MLDGVRTVKALAPTLALVAGLVAVVLLLLALSPAAPAPAPEPPAWSEIPIEPPMQRRSV